MKTILHVEQIFNNIPIYHVAVTYKLGPFARRFDFHPKRCRISVSGKRHSIPIAQTYRNPFEIALHEKSLNKQYILLFNDCRHYTQEMLRFSLVDCPDVINPFAVHQMFTSSNANET